MHPFMLSCSISQPQREKTGARTAIKAAQRPEIDLDWHNATREIHICYAQCDHMKIYEYYVHT